MSKESNFLIYCMERYRYFKGLSGAEVARTFDEYGICGYITKYFESLHTMGDHCIVQDIDAYISSITGGSLSKAYSSEKDSSCSSSKSGSTDKFA